MNLPPKLFPFLGVESATREYHRNLRRLIVGLLRKHGPMTYGAMLELVNEHIALYGLREACAHLEDGDDAGQSKVRTD